MNVIHTIASLIPEAGGTSRVTTGLCSALAQQVEQVQLLSVDVGRGFSAPLLPADHRVHTSFVPCRFALGLRQLWTPEFGKRLEALVQRHRINLIHDNGLWLPSNAAAAGVAHRHSVPLVVSPHGMLEPWALQFGRWRKKLLWRLYQQRSLARTQVIHATSPAEAESLRRFGLKQPIAVIPNGVDLPEPGSREQRVGSRKTLLFLSRIHPKKGLLNLVEALRQVKLEDWQIIIAGPEEAGHRAEVEAAVARAGLQDRFSFPGPVDDTAKWELYRRADLFVLPTFSENFGIVVAEALACGVPVITTTGAPWQSLETHCCGWWVEPQVESLAGALRAAMALSVEERQAMGQRGRQFVAANYGWPAVAEQMAAVYRWVVGQSERPAWVIS